jgi:class 3 adenylate cyclase
MAIKYDAIVIGTGQAGPSLAVRLADTGMKVAIIERKRFGGTCVNNGCIPTKTLVASARAAHVARRAGDYGVTIRSSIAVDMKKVKIRKDAVVRRSSDGVEKWLKSTQNLTVYEGHARFADAHRVRVGDALMALFGAPVASADDADRALRAALEMTTALDELNRQWHRRGLPTVGVGIGINTGVVVAGNMGSEKRLNYTVIGDGVTLASRLEELTKTPEYEARVIVSGATLAKAKEKYRTRRLGEVAVKGKQIPTEIFALLG